MKMLDNKQLDTLYSEFNRLLSLSIPANEQGMQISVLLDQYEQQVKSALSKVASEFCDKWRSYGYKELALIKDQGVPRYLVRATSVDQIIQAKRMCQSPVYLELTSVDYIKWLMAARDGSANVQIIDLYNPEDLK